MPETKTGATRATTKTPPAAGSNTGAGDSPQAATPLASAFPPSAAVAAEMWEDTPGWGDKVRRHAEASGEAEPAVFAAERFAAYLAPMPSPAFLESPAPEVPAVGSLGFAPDAVATFAETTGAALALARTEEAGRALAAFGDFPTDAHSRPRLGFTAPDLFPAGEAARQWWRKRRDAATQNGGNVTHRCAFTRVAFALPFGCPVPCLFLDAEDERGETFRIEKVLHPELHAAGPDAVARAAWKTLATDLESFGEAFADVFQRMALARALADPSAIGDEGSAAVLADRDGHLAYYSAK